jgi:hypothetical protein
MTSTLAARDQSARDRVGPEQYRITQQHRITQLEQQVEGLTRALQTRDTIGQAKGILLSRYAMGPDQAFAGAPRGARHVEPAGSHGDQHAPGPATTPSPDRSAARSVA